MDMAKNRHELAKEKYDQLLEIIKRRDSVVWDEARLWYELKSGNLYRELFGESGENDSEKAWGAFVKELGFPVSTVFMKVRLYSYWVMKKKIPLKVLQNIHTRKLDKAIPYVEDGLVTARDVLETATNPLVNYEAFVGWLKTL